MVIIISEKSLLNLEELKRKILGENSTSLTPLIPLKQGTTPLMPLKQGTTSIGGRLKDISSSSSLSFNNTYELKMYIAKEVIETKEVADILGCSRQYVNKLVKEQKIIPIKILNKNKLFYKPDILEIAEKKRKLI